MLLFQVQNPQEMTIAPFFAGHNIRARGFSNAPGKRHAEVSTWTASGAGIFALIVFKSAPVFGKFTVFLAQRCLFAV